MQQYYRTCYVQGMTITAHGINYNKICSQLLICVIIHVAAEYNWQLQNNTKVLIDLIDTPAINTNRTWSHTCTHACYQDISLIELWSPAGGEKELCTYLHVDK